MSSAKKIGKPSSRSEVISVRLNAERLQLLERCQNVLSKQLHRDVSLAETAFLVLEERAFGVDRAASRFEMLQTPTESLARIRSKWESQHTLSLAEWDVVALYVQIGTEEEQQIPPARWPAIPSRDSYLAVLDAFEAVYQLRKVQASPHLWSYFGNLDGYHTPVPLSPTDADQRHQALLAQIALQRDRLQTREPGYAPGHPGRCFQLAVHEEELESTDVDHALALYWPRLWVLAARGHWIRHQKPVRAEAPREPGPLDQVMALSPMILGDLTMRCTSFGGDPDFATFIEFGPVRQVCLLISWYPEWAALRAMLEGMADRPWVGRYYRAYPKPESTTRLVWMKRHEVCLDLSVTEWEGLRVLMEQASQHPDLQPRLDELRMQYGEQG